MKRSSRSFTVSPRGVRWSALLTGCLILAHSNCLPELAAQGAPTGDLPVIEPTAYRIIGSDSLGIQEAALSPDGRWVAYTASSPEAIYLWIIPSEGGEPSRLIESRNVGQPVWFPEGDRIAFRSGDALFTVPFDTETGKAVGPPQRVTLERTSRGFRVSPDGRWIAYATGHVGSIVIRVIPSNGGTARTVGEPCQRLWLWDWSRDGRFIYYMAQLEEAPDARPIMRVLVEGGALERVEHQPTGGSAPLVPYRIGAASGGADGGPYLQLQTADGGPVARLELQRNALPMRWIPQFSQDGRHLLTVVNNAAHPLRLLPTAGGPPMQLAETREWESPLGWSPDGSEVLFATTFDGRSVIMSAPVDGGAAREIGPMPDRGPPVSGLWSQPVTFSADGRYLTYSRPTPESMDRTLLVRPVGGGEDRIITRSLFYHEAFRLAGPGGTPNIAGDEFLYLERNGDRVEVRATPPTGQSRLLRSFPVADGQWAKGVFGDWVAYGLWVLGEEALEEPARIMVANGPDGIPEEVAAVEGVVAFDDIVWSPDGRWIAATSYVAAGPEVGSEMKVLLVGVTPDGEVSVPARLIDTPMVGSAWGLRWLPDGSAVTLYGQSLPSWRADVWLVPVQNGGRPVALTRDETGWIGFNTQSPDGRYIAYQADVFRGSSLWLADLGDALEKLSR